MTETYKIVLVGDSNVGKTSVLQRFAKDVFEKDSETTISPQFMTRMMDLPGSGTRVKLQIWDTAGQEKYRSVTPIYYRDASAAICVYDVTSRESLEDAKKWISDLRQYAPAHIVIGLAGNKCDLYSQEEVTLEEGKQFQDDHHIPIFQQTSAKENTGIEELFNQVTQLIETNKISIKKSKPQGESLDHPNSSNANNQGGSRYDKKCKC